jgi:hypothetical protein
MHPAGRIDSIVGRPAVGLNKRSLWAVEILPRTIPHVLARRRL